MIGYKAINENMQYKGFQFELGKWYEYEGGDKMCKSGFHFCEHPSGTWAYYNGAGTRRFKVEAEEVTLSEESGATRKHVAKRIRLVEEIYHDSNRNDGNGNTGKCNTGHYNTGHRNTGHYNAGHSNDGNCNAGHSNTGHRNTGHSNNGDYNTGHGNNGHCNAGDYNNGHSNAGDGNCGDGHSGSLNFGEAPFFLFNKRCNKEDVDFNLVRDLVYLLTRDEPIDPEPFLTLPNATKGKIKKLHNAHMEARK